MFADHSGKFEVWSFPILPFMWSFGPGYQRPLKHRVISTVLMYLNRVVLLKVNILGLNIIIIIYRTGSASGN